MSRVTPVQSNFNAGEISRRLHARIDLNLYSIAVAELTGWIPLVEGGIDACPGCLWVAVAKGPCRLIPFNYSLTQSYVVEMSAGTARLFTNDAPIVDDQGAPIEVDIPWSKEEIDALNYEQSYDVLYLFHPGHKTRLFARDDADAFSIEPLELENGPFEARNKDRGITVSASAVAGDVTLSAKKAGADHPLFEAGDVGGLFQIEADDFGDISSWEPAITVTNGQLLTWNERVYRVIGGSGRTGTVAPIHTSGVEWDGIGTGKDLNDKDAGGVQLEFICDRFGVLRITGFTDSAHVSATVIRRLPFTAATSTEYTGGYWDENWGNYVPPTGAVTYLYGSWRWRFGAFSDRRGWPSCGVVWNERLVLAKGSTLYGSVSGAFTDHSKYNEEGEISTDQAFIATIKDPNGVLSLVADDKLLIFTASGVFALGPANAAQSAGPGNLKAPRQNPEGASAARPIAMGDRKIYVGSSRRRVLDAEYSVESDKQAAFDLTRYARHMGQPRFAELVEQRDPNRLVWARREDGTLAYAVYVPSEQALGWAARPLASGMAARSIAPCKDPTGTLDQVWLAAEYRGAWHVLRIDNPRQEDDATDPAMVDMAFVYDGAPATEFGPVPLLAEQAVHVNADGALFMDITVDADGMFTLREPASKVTVGLPYPCRVTTLPVEAGGDNGPAMGKMRRVSRLVLNVLKAQGLRFRYPGQDWQDIEQLMTDSTTDAGFVSDTGILISEDAGDWDRFAQVTIERVAPCGATIRAVQPTVEVEQR